MRQALAISDLQYDNTGMCARKNGILVFDTGRVTMYSETTVHIGNSIVEVEDN